MLDDHDVRSCIDVTDSSGTVTNDDNDVTSLRQTHSSECDQSRLPAAEALALSPTEKLMSASRCSMCTQDQVKNVSAEGSQLTMEPRLSDDEHQFLELHRSRGAIPKCYSDRHPWSHSGNISPFTVMRCCFSALLAAFFSKSD